MGGGILTRFCDAVTRKKTVDPPTPGLQRQLSLVDLAAVGVSSVVGVGGYVCVGAGAADWAGPSIILSVLLASVSTILTGCACAELCVRIPRGGGVYTHVYTTLGELPAVMVASSLLLDLILLPAIAARSSSQYIEASINHSVSEMLQPRLTFIHDSRYFTPNYDLPALALVVLSMLMVVTGTKVVCQIGGVAVCLSLLVYSAISCTAFVRADLRHWTQHLGFFPHGLQGVLSGGALLSIGVIGGHTACLLTGESNRSKGGLSRLSMCVGLTTLLTLFPSAVAFTLASSSFEAAAPLGNLFSGASMASMRTLVGVGGILGLWAAIIGGLMGASRLLHRLACDGLAPRWLRTVSPYTATPWVSVILCSLLAATTATICSSWLLLRTAGTGGLSASVAGAAAVLSRRYRPQAHQSTEAPHTHTPPPVTTRCSSPKEMADLLSTSQRPYHAFDDTHPRQLSVEWESGNWVTGIVEPPTPPSWTTWKTSRFLMITFIINCVAGVGAVRSAKLLELGNWAWAAVALCVCGSFVCGFGLWLQPRHPPPTSIQRDWVPLLPLLAIFTNILLLIYLPSPALIGMVSTWLLGCLVWMVHGRMFSLEAILFKSLLTHSDHESPPDVL